MPAACRGPSAARSLGEAGRQRRRARRAAQKRRRRCRKGAASRCVDVPMTASSASRCAPPPISPPGEPISSAASPASARRRPAPRRRIAPGRASRCASSASAGNNANSRFLCAGRRRAEHRVPPACIAPIAYTGQAALQRDLADLRAATDAAGIKEAFVTSIAVGSLEMFCRGQNAHYARAEEFLSAIAEAIAVEYAPSSMPASSCRSTIPACPIPGTCSTRSRRSTQYEELRAAAHRGAEPRARTAFPRTACAIISAGAAGTARTPPTCRSRTSST